jgi:nucleoside triphosphate diphosphatase
MKPSREISGLLAIMAALRTPGSGCPWDLEQNFATIAPYTIEEAHEVADAIARNDMVDLADELGDLLLQVVFHARMAEEAGHFAFPDVVQAITSKMIRRHPHVFGEDAGRITPEEVKGLWGSIKAQEKAARHAARAEAGLPDDRPKGLLDGIPAALPALARAVKLQAKAGSVGFDWNDARLVIAKIREELDELEAELDKQDRDGMREELGDLLFAVANLARHTDVDPDGAVRDANQKFERRFRFIEESLAQRGKTPSQSTLDEMDELWNAAKTTELKRT